MDYGHGEISLQMLSFWKLTSLSRKKTSDKTNNIFDGAFEKRLTEYDRTTEQKEAS